MSSQDAIGILGAVSIFASAIFGLFSTLRKDDRSAQEAAADRADKKSSEARVDRIAADVERDRRLLALEQQVSALNLLVALWTRYSGHLQYLLSVAGKESPTFEQYAQMLEQHQNLRQVQSSPTPDGAPLPEAQKDKPT